MKFQQQIFSTETYRVTPNFASGRQSALTPTVSGQGHTVREVLSSFAKGDFTDGSALARSFSPLTVQDLEVAPVVPTTNIFDTLDFLRDNQINFDQSSAINNEIEEKEEEEKEKGGKE